MDYTAVIIDLKHSRALSHEQRQACQEKFKNAIEVLNDVYREHLRYEAVFSSGDSVQGLLYKSERALSYCFSMQAFMYPFKIRCALGIGTLYVHMEGESSNAQDGPAYHNASKAMDICKEHEYDVYIASKEPNVDFYPNNLLSIMQRFQALQSKKQKDVQNAFSLLFPANCLEPKDKRYQLAVPDFLRSNLVWYQTVDCSGLEQLDFSTLSLSESAALISAILHTSRQNIMQIHQAGNIAQVRKLQLVALRFLREYVDDKAKEES